MENIHQALETGYAIYKNVQVDQVSALSQGTDVVSATDGRLTVVQDGPMRTSLEASWHQDGLTYKRPPSIVLLYCEASGRGDITTDLADIAASLSRIDEASLNVLSQVDRYYVSRSGNEVYKAPLISTDSRNGIPTLSLSSRGWTEGAPI